MTSRRLAALERDLRADLDAQIAELGAADDATVVVAYTQLYENYNFGENAASSPRWKPKGGYDYLIAIPAGCDAATTLAMVRDRIERDNDLFREFIVGTEVWSASRITAREMERLIVLASDLGNAVAA